MCGEEAGRGMLSRLGALHLPKKMTVPRPSSLKRNPKKLKQERKEQACKRESFSFGGVVFRVARMLLEGERLVQRRLDKAHPIKSY